MVLAARRGRPALDSLAAGFEGSSLAGVEWSAGGSGAPWMASPCPPSGLLRRMSRVLLRIQLLRVGFGQHVLDGHGLVGPDGRLVGLALLFALLGAASLASLAIGAAPPRRCSLLC
jgi:hypothetical protein